MNVLGVCAGNGVIIHPFREFLIGNIEPRSIFHSKGDKQWEANFKGVPLYKSVKEARVGVKLPVNVVIGNPDCGHSSILSYSRKKALSDPRDNESLNLYIKCVKKYQPEVFLMENLPKLLEICDIPFWHKALPNYKINYIIKPVSEWGNSQVNRVRLVMIGVRSDLIGQHPNIQYHFLQIHKPGVLSTSAELALGLGEEDPKIAHVREDIDSIITLFAGFKISLRDVQRHWKENPTESRWIVKGRKFSTAPGVYRNISGKYPATARKANRQFNHDGLQMSPRELARVQGVPDSFKLHMDIGNKIYWINKGRATVTKTPPYQIGAWFYGRVINSKLWK